MSSFFWVVLSFGDQGEEALREKAGPLGRAAPAKRGRRLIPERGRGFSGVRKVTFGQKGSLVDSERKGIRRGYEQKFSKRVL